MYLIRITTNLLVAFTCAILLFSTTLSAHEVIHGLLIEGLDYSGKSTVAKLVGDQLRKKRYNIQVGHGEITGSDLSVFLARDAYNTLPTAIPTKFPDADFMERFIKLKLTGLIIDKMLSAETLKSFKKKNVFLIQDKYLLSVQCAKKFFMPHVNIPELRMFEEAYVPFRYNIYLTCDATTRKQRVQERGRVTDRLEQYMIVHMNELYKWDELCQSMVSDRTGWHIIDTTNATPEQIANQILELIENGNRAEKETLLPNDKRG